MTQQFSPFRFSFFQTVQSEFISYAL